MRRLVRKMFIYKLKRIRKFEYKLTYLIFHNMFHLLKVENILHFDNIHRCLTLKKCQIVEYFSKNFFNDHCLDLSYCFFFQKNNNLRETKIQYIEFRFSWIFEYFYDYLMALYSLSCIIWISHFKFFYDSKVKLSTFIFNERMLQELCNSGLNMVPKDFILTTILSKSIIISFIIMYVIGLFKSTIINIKQPSNVLPFHFLSSSFKSLNYDNTFFTKKFKYFVEFLRFY